MPQSPIFISSNSLKFQPVAARTSSTNWPVEYRCQAGILAAAAIVALEQMVERLQEDRENANQLAASLGKIPGLQVPGMEIDPKVKLTNMVFFKLMDEVPMDPEKLIDSLEQEHRIKIGQVAGRQFRMVTHYWITAEDVGRTLEAFQKIFC